MGFKTWRGDLAGGLSAAFTGLPVELVYGLLAVAPLSAGFAEHGVRAALWGCVLSGILALVFRLTGGIILGSRPATALVLGALASTLLERDAIQASANPEELIFLLMLLCTAMAGLLQCVFGLLGIGRTLKYVPYPVLSGLMCGVGLLIVKSTLRPMMGLPNSVSWEDSLTNWHPLSVMIALFTLGLCFMAAKSKRRLPVAAVALVGGGLLHHLLALVLGPENLGATSGNADGLLPHFSVWQTALDGSLLPLLRWLPTLLPYAAAIALFSALEILLCLSAIEATTHARGKSDGELMRQGLLSALSASLGATPVSGNLTRTMANLSSGGRSALSGVVYSLTIGLTILGAAHWFHLVPVAVTAGILLYYGQAMVDQGTRQIARQLFFSKSSIPAAQYQALMANFSVILLVALVSAFGQMMQGLVVGLVAAMVLFVRTNMKQVIRRVGDARHRRSHRVRSSEELDQLEQHGRRIVTIDLDGTLFFGTADQVSLVVENAIVHADWILLDFKRVSEIDATGAKAFLRISERLRSQRKNLLFCDMNERLKEILVVMGVGLPLHQENWLADMDSALEVAEDALLATLGVLVVSHTVSLQDTVPAQGMSPEQITILESYLTRTEFAAGDVVFRRGDVNNSLYIAGESAVDIVISLNGKRQKRIASFASGDVFGEMALLEGKPRSADAIVQSPGVVWSLSQDSLRAIEGQHPEISSKLLLNLSCCLAHRLRTTTIELSMLLEED